MLLYSQIHLLKNGKMMSLFRISFSMLLCFTTAVTAWGQVVVDIEFDNNKAKYLSGYSFGGYGPSDGSDAVSLDDDLSSEVADDASEGRPAVLADTNDDKESSQSDNGQSKKKDNACAKIMFDTSSVELPSDATFDYIGVGLGITFDLADAKLPSLKAADYEVSFDAKVSGTESLNQSKLVINFVTADGDDEDDFDDVVVQLARGEDDGTNAFTINSQYQTFTFSLDSLDERKGKMADLANAKLTGVTFNVQAQGNVSDFGIDKDNFLYVDNVRLIKK